MPIRTAPRRTGAHVPWGPGGSGEAGVLLGLGRGVVLAGTAVRTAIGTAVRAAVGTAAVVVPAQVLVLGHAPGGAVGGRARVRFRGRFGHVVVIERHVGPP